MNFPSEKHIEKYVLHRSELTNEEQRWIQDWIRKDEKVRLLVEWFKAFYRDTDEIESIEKRPDHFSSVIELKPDKKNSTFSSGVFVLAAQTSVRDRNKKNLKTIRTFVSEEHKTLIRILHNSNKNQTKLHVISEFVREDDIVLIEFRDRQKTLLVSEPGGTFVISDKKFSQEAIKNWSKCELHLLISKIRVYKDADQDSLNFDTTEAYFERDELDLSRMGDELHITFNSSDEKSPKKMVIYNQNRSTIGLIENKKCSLSIEDLPEAVTTLYFYK